MTGSVPSYAAQIISELGRGALMAKIDIAYAYRNIPVHPEDRHLLGMIWGDAFYMDTVLPFGLRSTPKIFSAISDTLEWIVKRVGITHCIHYLDDFLTIGKPLSDECKKFLSILIHQVCQLLGLYLWQWKR